MTEMDSSLCLELDSFVACAVMASVLPRWRDRVGWSVALGASDAVARVSGSSLIAHAAKTRLAPTRSG
jgi:hypothetical protein